VTVELIFARAAVTRGPEGEKLKNLHCQKPFLGNGWLRHKLEEDLSGAVVICEGWKSAVALLLLVVPNRVYK
jgi:hypothetical protein